MRGWLIFTLLIVLAGVLRVRPVHDARAEDGGRLAELNEQIEGESALLTRVDERLAKLELRSQNLKGQMNELAAEEKKLAAALAEIDLELKENENRVREKESEYSSLHTLSISRMRTLYMLKPQSVIERVVLFQNDKELSRSALYLSKIRHFDRTLLQKIESLKTLLVLEQERLSKAQDSQKRTQAKLSAQRDELRNKNVELQALISQGEVERKAHGESVIRLRAQALRLETVVVSLTNEEDVAPLPDLPSKSSSESSQAEIQKSAQFDGKGLFSYKGSLIVPIKGKLIQHFGKRKVKGFKDFVFTKGLTFTADSGSEVKAIAPGKVSYLGRLPGMGSVIILDHGKRSHSLYARIGETSVKRGDVIEKGAVLALAGSEEEQGVLYFEIRLNGTPIDPASYYRKGLLK